MTVRKSSDAKSTRTQVALLTEDSQRISEMAEMIAGKNVSDTTVNQAEQLLEEARSDKSAGKPSLADTKRVPAKTGPRRKTK